MNEQTIHAADVMKTVLAINGSYRSGGTTDQLVALIAGTLRCNGVAVEEVRLRDTPIAFCHNCRQCMQHPGAQPARCVIDDGMAVLVERLEAADGFILAAPTNLGSVTALFKRFMERLAVYAYWPAGAPAPRYRKAGQPRRPALLVSSSAAPGWLGRLFFSALGQLRMTARVIGARPVATLFAGGAARELDADLPTALQHRAVRRAQRLCVALTGH